MTSFEEYCTHLHPAYLNHLNETLNAETDIFQLQTLQLKIMYIIEQRICPLPKDERYDFLMDVFSRICQELGAAIGCLRHGSVSGAYHHFRGFIELRAALNYAKSKPKERLKKYAEFTALVKYQKHARLSKRLASGDITQEEFDNNNVLMPIDIAGFTPEKIAEWRKLWKAKTDDDLLKIKAWHHPSSIQDTLDALERIPAGEVNLFDISCNTTHFSPLTTNLTGRTLTMVSDIAWRMDELIQMIAIEVYRNTELLDEWFAGGCLFTQLAPVYALFKSRLARLEDPKDQNQTEAK